jgi:hypothetical protein
VSGQRGADGTLDGAEYLTFVPELYLRFRGVDVNVNEGGIEAYVYNANREPAHHEERVIRLLDCIQKHPA